MKTRWTIALASLLLVACSGGTVDSGRTGAQTAPEPRAGASSPAATPASPRPAAPAGGPDLSYSVLIPESEDETPIRWPSVFTGPTQTRLKGGVLWAPAAAVVRALSPKSMVSFEAGRLEIDGKPVSVPARLENGEPWAAVPPLARHLRAYAMVRPEDGSVALWTRDALLWLRDQGDPQNEILLGAKAAGLLDPGR